MSKNIAIFVDGTWNKAEAKRVLNTNVQKLFENSSTSASQLTHYVRGVRGLGGIGGWGTGARIKETYSYMCTTYDQGDHIYLFGFSRGALAIRSLAGFLDAVGILLSDFTDREHVKMAYSLYETGTDRNRSKLKRFLRDLTGAEQPSIEDGTTLPIYFIGVWDTVVALGLPGTTLFARANSFHKMELPSNVTHARHALALHELRDLYDATLWTGPSPKNPNQTLKQMWFPGAHADIGGGYKDNTTWSDLALNWISAEAVAVGYNLSSPLTGSSLTLAAPLHYERLPARNHRVRPALARRHALPRITQDTFDVHDSVARRLLDPASTQYRFSAKIQEALRNIDEIGLRFSLEKVLESASAVAPTTLPPLLAEWSKLRLDEAGDARHRVEAIVENVEAEISEIHYSDNATALCLLLLLRDKSDVLSNLAASVRTVNKDKLTLLDRINPKDSATIAESRMIVNDAIPRWIRRVNEKLEIVKRCRHLLPIQLADRAAAEETVLSDTLQMILGRLNMVRSRLLAAAH